MDVFANRDVCNLIMVDFATNKPILNFPYANTTTTSVTGESVFAYGGQGHPRRVTFYGEKGGTIAIETQMQSAELYSFMTGATIENTATLLKREVLTASGTTLTLSEEPLDGSVNVFKADDDCGTAVEADVEGTSVTITGASGDYVVYYLTTAATGVRKLNLKSTTFPKAVKIYADTYFKTSEDVVIPYKMIAYKASPQLNFEIAFSNTCDPASITITCDLLVDDDDNMLDMIFEDGEESA